jgi:restriction system protein
MKKTLSKSRSLGAEVIYVALGILKENSGEMAGSELIKKVEQIANLDDWAKEHYQKSGYTRWISIMHFFSIGCVKAGFLVKKNGFWYLTKEGEEAYKQNNKEQLLNLLDSKYKDWKESQKKEDVPSDNDDSKSGMEENIDLKTINEITLESAEEHALDSLKNFVNSRNPYEFQELVAALFRAMGYHTPFVAPKGKDGGVDIIAYKDPLGTTVPRIKVQCKHRENTASVQEVRELMGLLQKEGDVGIFVSTGGFSPDAKTTSRSALVHIELIDLNRLINLWKEFYSKMPDDDKQKLPLKAVYFLAPDEI